MRRERERERVYVYGKHALMEALANAPKVVKKVFLSHEAAKDRELQHLLSKASISVATLKGGREASRMVGEDTAHQGVVAVADTSALLSPLSEFLTSLRPSEDTMLVLLDELTDPHNVGAIIRSAAAFGAAGVLIPEHRQAPVTGAVVKASAGMVFRVPLVSIGNVNYAIEALQKQGFQAYALAMDGKKAIAEEAFGAPTVFVIGNEGRGIRQKTLERADVALRIPMHPRAESLNASVSAAVVMYAWSGRHAKAISTHS